MKNKAVYRKENQFYRILKIGNEKVLVIDCIKRTMPKWEPIEFLNRYEECDETELLEYLNIDFTTELTEKCKAVMNERFSLIAGIVALVHNATLRSEAIAIAEEEYHISKQTIRTYLCDYLAFNNIRALAPKVRTEKTLSNDEKNIRWALNKFYYNTNKNTLKTAYTMMLKNKYCDDDGNLLETYPTYHQFRYFFRKTKSLQTLYISRDGLATYQRDKRPLLGDSSKAFAPNIGVGMLDATVCDIYLCNEAGQNIGRPILTACIDAYSGMCLGYSLTLEGGMYSLRDLMLNIIMNKQELCENKGILINEEEWNVRELPYKFITDKGSEYKGENFENLTELGITVVNLPPYRPDLKGAVEKFFDCVQGYFKPYLKGKGIVEKDWGERGRHDYRKDASLTLEQFEKVLLHCIIFYNTKRVLNDFLFTEDMLTNKVKPYANEIWNYGKEQCSALVEVSKENLIMTLLPRTTAKFKRNGLWANGLRYKNPAFNEEYLKGNEVIVAYNPDNVGKIWLIESSSYIEFTLIESRFEDMELAKVNNIKQQQKELCQIAKANMTQTSPATATPSLDITQQNKSSL